MKSRLKGPVEWVDPYEFLVAVKKEPTLSNLALANLELSDQTVVSTKEALENYLSIVFQVIKDKLINITKPIEITDDDKNLNHNHSPNKNLLNNNQIRPIISIDDVNLTFEKIRLDIISHISDVLEDRFRSDRFTLQNYKKKIAEQLENNRNAAQEFRKGYDISARNRHEESIRVMQQYETEKYTEETTRLRNIIKDLEHSQSALLKKLSNIEEEKVTLSRTVDNANTTIEKLSKELKAMKDAKKKQGRPDSQRSFMIPNETMPSNSNVPGSPSNERRSLMLNSRSSKDFTNLVSQSPPLTLSSPIASPIASIEKHLPLLCQKCIIYEEDVKNLKSIIIQLTSLNANTEIQKSPESQINFRPQTATSITNENVQIIAHVLNDVTPTSARSMLSAPDIKNPELTQHMPVIDTNVQISHIQDTIDSTNANLISNNDDKNIPVNPVDDVITSTNDNGNKTINYIETTSVTINNNNNSDSKQIEPTTELTSQKIPDSTLLDETVKANAMLSSVSSPPPLSNINNNNNNNNNNSNNNNNENELISSLSLVTTKKSIEKESNNTNTSTNTKEKKNKQSKQQIGTQDLNINTDQGGYLGFGPTSKDFKKLNKGGLGGMQADTSLTSPIQRKQNRNYHENLSAVSFASAESNASMSDYNGLRPSTSLSDMSRDDRVNVTEEMYVLAKGRGVLSQEALQTINKKNEIIIQEYQTKVLSLEYQIRNLSKRIRSDEVFMERLDYLNALRMQERDILLTTVCNQLKALKEEKEREIHLKKLAKSEMPLQLPKQIIQSKKSLPLPNIKFDVSIEPETQYQIQESKSIPNLPYSRYLESLQVSRPIISNVNIHDNNIENTRNSIQLLEERAFKYNNIDNNDNHKKIIPRLPITDELFGDESIEKILKSDPDALYEYRHVRKQILALVVEHKKQISSTLPKKKALDISLRKPFHL